MVLSIAIHNLSALEHWSLVPQTQKHCFELQTTDVELAFCTEPGSQNLGILHMGIPPWVETSVRIVMSAWKVPKGIPVVKKKGPAIALQEEKKMV